MNPGIHAWFGFDLPYRKRLHAIRRHGFDAVMFFLFEDASVFEAVKGAKEAHLNVLNAHLPYRNINSLWENTPAGDEYMSILLSLIGDAGVAGIDTLVIHPSDGDHPPLPSAVGTERFRRLTEAAAKRDIVLALENVRVREHFDHLLTKISDRHLQVCYDAGHHHCSSDDREILLRYKGRIRAVHLHDNDGKEDQHLIPFQGTIDWSREMRLLRESSYNGALALEVMGNPGSDADAYLSKAKTALERLTLLFKES
jgi:sugar phosphate isomerase/epimerase